MNDLAAALDHQLKAAGMKPSELAIRSGISKSYICRILKGHRGNPSAQVVQAWANALGCPVAAFFIPRTCPKGHKNP